MKKIIYILLIALVTSIFTDQIKAQGYSIILDGINDLVDCGIPAYPNFSSTDSFTIECFIKPDGNQYGRILSYFPQTGNNNFAIQLTLTPSNFLAFNVSQYTGSPNPPAAQLISNNPVALNFWNHIVAIYNNGLLKIYIGGKFEGSLTYTGPFCPTPINGKLYFGYIPYEPTERFSGNLEEMRISNIPRYNTNFTAPCTEFINDTNTIGL